GDGDEGVHRGLGRLDPGQARLDELQRRQGAVVDGAGGVDQAQLPRLHGIRRNVGGADGVNRRGDERLRPFQARMAHANDQTGCQSTPASPCSALIRKPPATASARYSGCRSRPVDVTATSPRGPVKLIPGRAPTSDAGSMVPAALAARAYRWM